MSSLLNIQIKPITSATSADVVSLAQVKEYIRVDFNDDDALIQGLIDASIDRIERYACRVILQSACTAFYVQYGCGDRISLAYNDNISLSGDSATSYAITGGSYISTCDKEVTLTYTAGYPAADMPEWVKQAVYIDVAYRYENRGDMSINANVVNQELIQHLKPHVRWAML